MNFFLDVDGTLLPFGCRHVPESGVKAIREARAEGHRVFFATGRSDKEITDELYSVGFDGGVFAAGGLIIVDGKEIYHYVLPEEDKEFLLGYCRDHNMDLLVQSDNGTWATPKAMRHWHDMLLRFLGADVSVDGLRVADELPPGTTVNKILYITDEGTLEDVRRDLCPRFIVIANTLGIPGDLMGEVSPAGITKATGIRRVIDYLGDGPESVCAIGDGSNDLEMIETSYLGIAMGNAMEEVKAVAGYVAPDVDKDGLAAAFRHALGKD